MARRQTEIARAARVPTMRAVARRGPPSSRPPAGAAALRVIGLGDMCDSVADGKRRERTLGGHRPVSRVLSVPRVCTRGHRTVIPLGPQSPTDSCSLPAARRVATPWSRRAVSRRLFGLAPAGVCRATDVATGAVGSYPTLSPLPPFVPRHARRRFAFCCTVRHAKLAPRAPRRYLATCPVEPGLSSAGCVLPRPDATVRPVTTHGHPQYTPAGEGGCHVSASV